MKSKSRTRAISPQADRSKPRNVPVRNVDPDSMKPKVLLADDHTIVAEGVSRLLEEDFRIVGCVSDGRAAVSAVRVLAPDIAILDIFMPQLNGFDAAREIRKLNEKVKIVFLTMYTEVPYVQAAFEVGAAAYVAKQSAATDLRLAIRKALMGQIYITPSLTNEEVSTFLRSTRFNKRSPRAVTPRQREVLQLLAEGHSAKEIASILNLSPRTVEYHKYRLMHQLGVQNTTSLLRFAMRNGIIGG